MVKDNLSSTLKLTDIPAKYNIVTQKILTIFDFIFIKLKKNFLRPFVFIYNENPPAQDPGNTERVTESFV